MKKQLLIVEDDQWLADMYKDVLEEHFTNTTVAADAQEAAELLDKELPDAILLDFMLPGGNGAAFLHELRSYEDTAKIPVLVCTSIRFTDQQKKSLQQFAPLTLVDKSDITPERLKKALVDAYAKE